jgi:multidrug resistance efflux pump
MIGYLKAIFTALLRVLEGQDEAARQAEADLAALLARVDALEAVVTSMSAELAAAVEHLRVLIEDSDPNPAVVGAPTFTPQE